MGLDTVELVTEVEETFDISIANEDAAAIVTVGDLYRCVLGRLAAKGPPVNRSTCPTAHAFYSLRRAWIEGWGHERAAFRPGVASADVFRRDRRLTWDLLREGSGLRLPPLERPDWVGLAILVAVLGSIPAACLGLWSGGVCDPSTFVVAALTIPPATMVALLAITRPLATSFPSGCETIRGLTRSVVALNLGALVERTGRVPSHDEVWDAVRALVVEQLGVRPERVTEEARIVQDLGAD